MSEQLEQPERAERGEQAQQPERAEQAERAQQPEQPEQPEQAQQPEQPERAEHADRSPEILARGPWTLEQIRTHWREEPFEPSPAQIEAADAAIRGLRERGSPSHDGVAARMAGYRQDREGITIELQPVRWALRLIGDACHSMAALCVTRSSDGRWLAGRRAEWVSSWAGRWALGAGGAVDLGENPGNTLVRELREEWAVSPERVRGEALLRLPHEMVMFVGQAWLAEGVEGQVRPDHEHDAFAWWPREIDEWPEESGEALARMARWLSE